MPTGDILAETHNLLARYKEKGNVDPTYVALLQLQTSAAHTVMLETVEAKMDEFFKRMDRMEEKMFPTRRERARPQPARGPRQVQQEPAARGDHPASTRGNPRVRKDPRGQTETPITRRIRNKRTAQAHAAAAKRK